MLNVTPISEAIMSENQLPGILNAVIRMNHNQNPPILVDSPLPLSNDRPRDMYSRGLSDPVTCVALMDNDEYMMGRMDRRDHYS